MSNQSTIGALVEQGVVSLQTGPFGSQLHSYDYRDEGIAVVPTEGIKDGRIDHSVLPLVSTEKARELARHRLELNDILFARRGVQATGRTAIVRRGEVGFLCGTGAIRLRVAKGQTVVDPRFLAWLLAVPDTVTWIREQAIGATMPNLNEGIIRRLSVRLPTPDQQHAIACLLDALDDKIELNRRTSATLEEMARALFRSWFVDFDPVHAKARGEAPAHMDGATAALFPDSFGEDGPPLSWRPGLLGDVAIAPRVGVDPNSVDPETPYIGLEHMPRRSITLAEWDTAGRVGSQKSAMRAGDFLFGKLRPYFHKVGVAPVDGVCSTEIVVVRSKSDDWSGYVLSVISSDAFVEHTNASSAGTRMPRTNWRDMAAYEVVLPTMDVAKAYETIVGPWRSRIVAASHESRTLAALRDSLLPKLMSGELRVRDAEQQIAEAV